MHTLLLLCLTLLVGVARPNEVSDADATPTSSMKLIGKPDKGRVRANPVSNQAVLKCSYNDTDDALSSISWLRIDQAGQELTLGAQDTLEYASIEEDAQDASTSVLTLTNFPPGQYRCRVEQLHYEWEFNVENVFKLEKAAKSETVTEGQDERIYCRLKLGSDLTSNPRFRWFRLTEEEAHEARFAPSQEAVNFGKELFANESESTVDVVEPHIRIITVLNQTMLKIEDAVSTDRGVYQCVVSNDYGQFLKHQTMIRVKDKYAALYPFCGIVIEVVLLCLIIFLCEKSKSKEAGDDGAMEEDEAGGGGAGGYNGGAVGHGNSNARHRRM